MANATNFEVKCEFCENGSLIFDNRTSKEINTDAKLYCARCNRCDYIFETDSRAEIEKLFRIE